MPESIRLPVPVPVPVLALALAAAVAPVAAAEPSVPASREGVLAGSLKPFVDRGVLAGAAVLAASREKTLAVEAVGSADIAGKRPMASDDLFWIASMSKPITATLLLMLVDEGKVSLDDPVEKHLPDFRGQMVAVEEGPDRLVLRRPARPITVRDLLTHTSGLPFLSRIERKIDGLPLREASIGYALANLRFEPGTKYEYSNAGINTAGRIVEVAGGLPFEEFLEKRLTKPLGMKDTTFWPDREQIGRLAKSYRPAPGGKGLEEIPIDQLTYPLDDRRRGPSPAGGLFSTAADMGLFGRMILSGGTLDGRRYVSVEAVRRMTATATGDLFGKGAEGGYGLGWSTTRRWKEGSDAAVAGECGHGGAYATNLWIDPARDLVTVFLVQHAGFPGGEGDRILPAFRQAAIEALGR